MNLDETRLLLGLPSRDSMKTFAAQLKSQMSADIQTTKLRAASASPMNLDETRLLLGLPSRDSMKAFAAQLKSDMQELQKAQLKASKLDIPVSQVGGAFTAYDAQAKSTQNLTNANKSLSGSFKQLALDGKDVHSMARGLASSFGLLWLTWGNLIPLFAGAAISSSVKNVVTLGAEVQHTMETIRVLSQESTSAVAGLNEQLLELARSGPAGPQEIANAMKTLSLAGLSAGEVSASIKDVLNFAVAGTTDLKTAADVMTSVAAAFSITAHGYNYVGDVISKTAAVSKSSVESIGEAFKTSSVLNKQYGVSLEDVGVGLAALSQLGIQGSAGGTALRNMYVDLSGRTPQVTKAMEALKLELQDGNGRFLDIITMTQRLGTALDELSGKGRAKALLTILSERGGKPIIELLDLAKRRAKDLSSTYETELERIKYQINNSAGFMAQAAIQLAMTPESQLKSIKASLQATLVETFAGMEPEILAFSRDLKNLLNSPEFKEGLKALATGALDFGRALAKVTATVVEHTNAVLAVVAAYYATRTGLIAYTALTAASTAATVANTAATAANGAAKVGMLAGLARVIPGVGTFVTAAGLAWAGYETFVNSAKRAEQGYVDSGYGASIIQKLREETERINELNQAKELGMTLDELRARKAVSNSALESSAARISAENKVQRAAEILEKRKAEGQKGVIKDKARDLAEAQMELDDARKVEGLQIRKIESLRRLHSLAAKREAELNKPVRPDIKGTKPFAMPGETGAGEVGTGPRATLDEIIKREKEQRAALEAAGGAAAEFDKINQELAKNLAGLSESYDNILKNYKDLGPAERKALHLQKAKAESLIRSNAVLQTNQLLAKQQYDYTNKQIEAMYQERQATEELANARFKAAKESERQIGLADQRFEFEQSIKNELSIVQAAEKAKYEVRATYAEKLRNLELEHNKRLVDMGLAGLNLAPELDSFNRAKEAMNKEATAQEAKASAQIYKTEWDKASSELARARKEAAKESERQTVLMDDKANFENSLRYKLSTVQAAERAQYEVRATYAEKQRQLRLDTEKLLQDMYHEDGTPREGADVVGAVDAFQRAKQAMNKEAITQEAKAITQIYKTEWDKVTGTIASNFTSKLMNGTLDIEEFMVETFANMVLQPQLNLLMQQGADALLGGVGGWFSTLMGMPSFEGGGSTGTGSRSGGLDGKGGYMAMVHPNETVVDHTKGGGMQASSAPVYITINNTVGDVATKSMLDQANAATVKQIHAGMARSARYNGAMARG